MITPSFQEFKRLAKKGNLIPVFKEILADMETPVSAFKKLTDPGLNTEPLSENSPTGNGNHQGLDPSHSFLLESVEGGEEWGRYSFLGVGPSVVFTCKGNFVEVIRNGEMSYGRDVDEPLTKIKELMEKYRPAPTPDLPRFYGGAVGFLSYDMVRFMEDLPDSTKNDLNIYDAYFVITDNILIFDNVKNTILILANILTDDFPNLEDAYVEATSRINRIIHRLDEPLKARHIETDNGIPLIVDSNLTKKEFISAVSDAKKYIVDGDIIQVVLSQRFELDTPGDPFDLYRALRTINPSPYMFYLNFESITMIGSSPEVLVRKEGDMVELRPIAGTRPRGKDSKEDSALEEELLNDPKELAEHVMLVDLGRNDLGRISEFGSVTVKALKRIERYSHVMHIVSDIEGKLKPGKDSFDVLRAVFPAGTLTGAPKIRAMEIIDELEPCRRGPYGGSVGYFSFSGNMDMCITIRTMLIKDKKLYLQAGAGIVYDSIPEKEYEETQHKARGMLRAAEMVRKNMELK